MRGRTASYDWVNKKPLSGEKTKSLRKPHGASAPDTFVVLTRRCGCSVPCSPVPSQRVHHHEDEAVEGGRHRTAIDIVRLVLGKAREQRLVGKEARCEDDDGDGDQQVRRTKQER